MATVNITIRLRPKLVKIHESRRYEKAPKFLREMIARHSKSHVDDVKLSTDINRYLQANTTNRYKPIKLSFSKTGETVNVDLADEIKKRITRPVVAAPAKPGEKKDAKKPVKGPEEAKADEERAKKKQEEEAAAKAAKQKAAKQPAKPADNAAQ
jgi:ribosomal protein L31E